MCIGAGGLKLPASLRSPINLARSVLIEDQPVRRTQALPDCIKLTGQRMFRRVWFIQQAGIRIGEDQCWLGWQSVDFGDHFVCVVGSLRRFEGPAEHLNLDPGSLSQNLDVVDIPEMPAHLRRHFGVAEFRLQQRHIFIWPQVGDLQYQPGTVSASEFDQNSPFDKVSVVTVPFISHVFIISIVTVAAVAYGVSERFGTVQEIIMNRTVMLAVVCLLARAALGAGADTAPPPAPREGFSVDLGGEWRVQPLARTDEGITATIADPDPTPEAWGSMQVPGQATQIRQGEGDVWKGFDAKKLHGVWLEREVVIPAEWAVRRIILRGELVEQPLIVRVNGGLVGTLVPPGDGLNLTNAIAPVRTHTLRLAVLAGEAAPDGAPQHVTGPIGRLGIAGSLRLDAVAPRVALEGVFLMPSVRMKRLGARVRVYAAAAEKRVTLRAAVTETDGSPVRQFETTISVGKGESFREVFFPWRDPVLWELDRPHLYRITIAALGSDGTPLDTWGPQTFGFREFRVDGKEMLLNEHPCRFRLLWHWGVGENNIAFYQGIGFNAIAIQPRDGRWFEGAGAKAGLYRHYNWNSTQADAAAVNEEIKRLNSELRHIQEHLAIADPVPWAENPRPDELLVSSLLAGDDALIVILIRKTRGETDGSGEQIKVNLRLPPSFLAKKLFVVTPDGLDVHQWPAGDPGQGQSSIHAKIPEAAQAYVITLGRAEDER